MFNQKELEIIKKSLNKKENKELYKKINNQLKQQEDKFKKVMPSIESTEEKEKIKDLFQKKDEEALIQILKNKNPNSILQNRNGLPQSYHRDDILLYYSSIYGMEKLTKILIDNNAEVNKYSYILLNALAYNKENPVVIAKILMKKNLNVHAIGEYNQLPLHRALENENDKLVQFLLENKVDPSSYGFQKTTSLHCAKTSKMINLLLDYGADINKINQYGDSPLVYQARMSSCRSVEKLQDIIITLAKRGASKNIKNKWDHDFYFYANKYKESNTYFVNNPMRMLPVYKELKLNNII